MRILLLNPNSSTAMTNGMLLAARSTPLSASLDIVPMTATSAPASINDDQDIRDSTQDILASLADNPDTFGGYDAMLIACFSAHPLVPHLSCRFDIPVTGIFEASILGAMSLLKPLERWGIVTTGKFWEKHLWLTAGDFHTVSLEEVKEKLTSAARRLLKSGNVTCVVMGCGGMAGLEDTIRATAADVHGASKAKSLYIRRRQGGYSSTSPKHPRRANFQTKR
ncbi:Nucleolar GTP-binding protein 1 [Epichloe bromicola]|uniref:Nucleolar GTP-binding protein 1 n=1 Tax=Epichloe bromicola TaxID=79588 RepID=A0ABQ0CL54_9HYPO